MTKPATPLKMWAAVFIAADGRCTESIHSGTIRHTRKEARAAYLQVWAPGSAKLALSWVRFQRVVVSVEGST